MPWGLTSILEGRGGGGGRGFMADGIIEGCCLVNI